MNYKMIVTDFDGTMLRSNNTVSERTVELINEYIAAGGRFMVATGRMHCSIMRWLDRLDLARFNIPVITYQGALIKESQTGKTLFDLNIPKSTAVSLIEYYENRGSYVHIYCGDELFVEKDCKEAQSYASYVDVDFKVVGRLSQFAKRDDVSVRKILYMDTPQAVEKEVLLLRQRFLGSGVNFDISYVNFIDSVNDASGKGSAVVKIAKLYDIPLESVVCVGDSMNDISMIRTAGLGVAVANARNDVKMAADMVGRANDDDAVADVIERVLEGKL